MEEEMERDGLVFVTETDSAILVSDLETGDDHWLPKSQIEYDEDAEVDDVITVSMPAWLYEREFM